MRESYLLYTDQLDKEYLQAFQRVELYMVTAEIDPTSREERLSDLLDIFLSAQEKGRSPESVVGRDLEPFCRAFCADYGVKNRLLSLLDNLKNIALCMLFFVFLDSLAIESADFWGVFTTLNVSGFFFGILLVMALNVVTGFGVRRLMFRKKRVSMKVLNSILLGVGAVSTVGAFALLSSDYANLFRCPLWVLLVAGGGYLALYYPFNYKRVKKQRSLKIRFRDIAGTEMEKVFPKEMERKFEKQKRRYAKKSKPPLTWKVFLEEEEKECQRLEKMKYFYFALPIGVSAIALCTTEGFDGWTEKLFFSLFLLGIEYLSMLGLWKFLKKSIALRRTWIRDKRAELAAESAKVP